MSLKDDFESLPEDWEEIPDQAGKGGSANTGYETREIEDPLEIIEKFTVSVRSEPTIVWRGQSCSEWDSMPSLFRSEPKSRNWTWDSQGIRAFAKFC